MARATRVLLLVTLGLVLGFGQLLASAQEPPMPKPAAAGDQRPTTTESIAKALALSVSDPTAFEFAFCHLRAAWWGNYDVTVRVGGTATTDRQPRILKMTQGTLSQSPDPDTTVNLVTVTGGGDIVFASKEEAFAKGVPFFISDATLKSATELKYAVHSNPAVAVSRALSFREARTEPVNGTYHVISTVDYSKRLSSKREPQAQTRKFPEPFDPKASNRFLFVTLVGSGGRCPVSNTIDLDALLKVLPPK
jgi:hypothetical protein